MTTNLSKGEPTYHEAGTLWRLVRASMTIVGLVPPVYEDGDLLVDGGYLNNMPVDVMHSMGALCSVHKGLVQNLFNTRQAATWRDGKCKANARCHALYACERFT